MKDNNSAFFAGKKELSSLTFHLPNRHVQFGNIPTYIPRKD